MLQGRRRRSEAAMTHSEGGRPMVAGVRMGVEIGSVTFSRWLRGVELQRVAAPLPRLGIITPLHANSTTSSHSPSLVSIPDVVLAAVCGPQNLYQNTRNVYFRCHRRFCGVGARPSVHSTCGWIRQRGRRRGHRRHRAWKWDFRNAPPQPPSRAA